VSLVYLITPGKPSLVSSFTSYAMQPCHINSWTWLTDSVVVCEWMQDRPSTKVHAAPGGGSSLGYLFGGNWCWCWRSPSYPPCYVWIVNNRCCRFMCVCTPCNALCLISMRQTSRPVWGRNLSLNFRANRVRCAWTFIISRRCTQLLVSFAPLWWYGLVVAHGIYLCFFTYLWNVVPLLISMRLVKCSCMLTRLAEQLSIAWRGLWSGFGFAKMVIEETVVAKESWK